MFVDLVSSTMLGARLDPEDLRKVITTYQECIRSVVARLDGFVARYMGDGALIYFGFPLHAAGRPGIERGHHLADIRIPMLFLQGSRDALAELKLLKSLCAKLGKRSELFIVDGGDHSFHMLKSSKKSDEQILDEVVSKAALWMRTISGQ